MQLSERYHIPEREDGDLEASGAEVTEHHVLGIEFRFDSHLEELIDVIRVCCKSARGVWD
jgi:hypothetical protein